jgi:GAF domain-containing protein
MRDEFAAEVAARGDDPRLRALLDEACAITGMGFAAIARVTEARWIAAQVLDQIGFGLKPGDELVISTTICNDIRDSGQTIVIDHVAGSEAWRTHHTPALYGFESYVSVPFWLDDGSFYGTFCAIDPEPRLLSAPATVAAIEGLAKQAAAILSERIRP